MQELKCLTFAFTPLTSALEGRRSIGGLATWINPLTDKVVVGGDFNCTMDPRLDRSHYRRVSDHESPAFAHLVAQWGLVDALTPPDDTSHIDLAADHDRTHTYRYSLQSGGGGHITLGQVVRDPAPIGLDC